MTRRITARPCWTPSGAQYALPIDAGAMDDELFRFVHVPGLITRYRFRGFGSQPGEGDEVSEDDVLRDLLVGDAVMRVAAVVGEVGTGKSHLVRWLYTEIQRRKAVDEKLANLHVVYIPKTRTTLRGIVGRILEDQKGERFDEFKDRLATAQDTFNRNTAPRRLLDALANAIRDLADLDDAKEDAYRAKLIQELPVLLQDPVYSEALLRPGGVIRRTIDRALERAGTGESERPEFTEEDLHLDLADLSDMAPPALKLFRKLSGQRFKTAAVALMNQQLDRSIGELFNVRRGEIGEVMVDVRAELERQGRELVLLIEDLALLTGVEDELLEAIIAPAQEVGGRRLCPVRASFAVTSGRLQHMDTVLSRVDADGGYQYSLDADVRGDAPGRHADLEDVVDLVGSYLNAARVGEGDIKKWYSETLGRGDAEPYNGCQNCDLVEDCHRGFEASRSGHGLYPFNRRALQRMLIGQPRRNFEPRELLKHVRETLAAVSKGSFPSRAWAARYNPALTPVATLVRNRLKEYHRDDELAQRAEYLLMFWAGATQQVVNLDSDVHQVFGIDEVPDAPRAEEAPGPTSEPEALPGGDGKRPGPAPSKSPIEQDVEHVAAWRTAIESGASHQQELDTVIARDVRSDVAAAVLERAAVGLRFLSYRQSQVTALADRIHIEGAAAGNPRNASSIVISLDQRDEALVLALRKRHRKVTLDFDDVVALAEGVDRHLSAALEWLENELGDATAVRQAVHLRLMVAMLSGDDLALDGTLASDAVAVPAILTATLDPNVPGVPAKLAEVMRGLQAREATAEANELINARLAIRQSVTQGGPSGVDAAAIVKLVDFLVKNKLAPAPTRARSGIPAVLARVSELAAPALEEARVAAKRAQQRMADLLPDNATATEVAEAFRAAVDALTNASALVEDLTRLRTVAEEIRHVELDVVREALERYLRADGMSERVVAAAALPWRDVERVERFLATADQALTNSAARLGGAEDDLADPVGAREAAREAGARLVDRMKSAAGNLDAEVSGVR